MDRLDYWFKNFSVTAIRLETLGRYVIYDTNEFEEFAKFKKHEKIEGFANQAWLDDIKIWKEANKRIERIRIVPSIKTDYFKYEFEWCYPRNLQYGENILFVYEEEYKKIKQNFPFVGDFWMFDDKAIVTLNYTLQYEYEDCKEILQEKLVDEYKRCYQILKEKSISYSMVEY